MGFKYSRKHELGCMILAVSKMILAETILRFITLYNAAKIIYNGKIETRMQRTIKLYSAMNIKRRVIFLF